MIFDKILQNKAFYLIQSDINVWRRTWLLGYTAGHSNDHNSASYKELLQYTDYKLSLFLMYFNIQNSTIARTLWALSKVVCNCARLFATVLNCHTMNRTWEQCFNAAVKCKNKKINKRRSQGSLFCTYVRNKGKKILKTKHC